MTSTLPLPLPCVTTPQNPLSGALATALVPLRLAALLPVLPVAAVLLHQRSARPGHALPAWRCDVTLWHPDPSVELTVVMPFYNPGAAMRPTVERIVAALRARATTFEVVCVSDGSTDGSEHSLHGIGHEVRVLVNAVNRGKGAALHTGFAHARGQYVGMVDCDGDIDPTHLVDYLDRAKAHDADVVYADKRMAASTSKSSPARKVVSLGFSSLVGTLFALGVRDTQTGCKLFRREALQTVLPRLHEERFAFDLEFFVAAKAAGLRRLHPAPVHLGERLAGSTVSSRAILRTLVDALTVFGRLHLSGSYKRSAAVPDAVVDIRPTEIRTRPAVHMPQQRSAALAVAAA